MLYLLIANDARQAEEADRSTVARRSSSVDPPHDSRDPVDRYLRPLRYPPRRTGNAEHHGNPALARERREMRGSAAKFGDDGRYARKDLAKRGAGNLRHQDITEADAREFTLAANNDASP
jgi:hypothetical protein